jgi:hypothetical protein
LLREIAKPALSKVKREDFAHEFAPAFTRSDQPQASSKKPPKRTGFGGFLLLSLIEIQFRKASICTGKFSEA